MVKAEDIDHTILANMKWIHNLQRAQMRERHVAEIKQVQKDLEKSIDWDIIANLYPPNQEGFKQFVNPIVRQGLNSPGRFLKPTPLDVLPAAHRTVLVQKDQFERLRRERQKEAIKNGVEPEPQSELSVAEIEFYLEDMMSEEIAKRKEEEWALYALQEEEKHPIYKSMQKKMDSGRAGLSKEHPANEPLTKEPPAQDPPAKDPPTKVEPRRKLAKKTSLPPLRTTENLVHQMQGVTLTRPAINSATSAVEAPKSANSSGRRASPRGRRFSATDIPENRLPPVYDRRSPRRDTDVEAAPTPTCPSADREQPQEQHGRKRRASENVIQTDKAASTATDGQPPAHKPKIDDIPLQRRNPEDPPNAPSSIPPALPSTKSNPWYSETSEWAQARRRSENSTISPRDRSRSPSRRPSDDAQPSRRYSAQEARPWNVWVNPNSGSKSSTSSPSVSERQGSDAGSTVSRRESLPRRESPPRAEFDPPRGPARDRRSSEYDRGDREHRPRGIDREYSWPSSTSRGDRETNWHDGAQNRGGGTARRTASSSWRSRGTAYSFRGQGRGRGRGEDGSDRNPNDTPLGERRQWRGPGAGRRDFHRRT
ncbi:hypothetical protein TWF696_004057 [Orbilia brochopaga]